MDTEYLIGKLIKIDSQVERAAAIIDHMRIFGRKSDGDKSVFVDFYCLSLELPPPLNVFA